MNYYGFTFTIMLYFNYLLYKKFYNIYGSYVLYVSNRWQWFSYNFYSLPEDDAVLRLRI
jgi:hypothetical protein